MSLIWFSIYILALTATSSFVSVSATPGDTVLSIDDSSTLTFLQQSRNLEMEGDCPSIDVCMQNCRKSYTVEATQSQYILTSTYADTSECVCDKLVFTSASIRGDSATFNWKFDYVIEDSDTGDVGFLALAPVSSTAMNIVLFECFGRCTPESFSSEFYYEECYWEYTISQPPVPSNAQKIKAYASSVASVVMILMFTY